MERIPKAEQRKDSNPPPSSSMSMKYSLAESEREPVNSPDEDHYNDIDDDFQGMQETPECNNERIVFSHYKVCRILVLNYSPYICISSFISRYFLLSHMKMLVLSLLDFMLSFMKWRPHLLDWQSIDSTPKRSVLWMTNYTPWIWKYTCECGYYGVHLNLLCKPGKKTTQDIAWLWFDTWPLSVAAAEAAAAEENGYLDPQQEPRDSTTNTAEYNDDLQYKRDNSTATTKTQVYLPSTPACTQIMLTCICTMVMRLFTEKAV